MVYVLLLILAAFMAFASFMIVTRAGEKDGVCKYNEKED